MLKKVLILAICITATNTSYSGKLAEVAELAKIYGCTITMTALYTYAHCSLGNRIYYANPKVTPECAAQLATLFLTFRFGNLIAICTALAARVGCWPRLSVTDIIIPILSLAGSVTLSSSTAGLIKASKTLGLAGVQHFNSISCSWVSNDNVTQEQLIECAENTKIAALNAARTTAAIGSIALIAYIFYKRYSLYLEQKAKEGSKPNQSKQPTLTACSIKS